MIGDQIVLNFQQRIFYDITTTIQIFLRPIINYLQMTLRFESILFGLVLLAQTLWANPYSTALTPKGLADMHPEFIARLRPERMTFRHMQLPNQLNRRLQLFTLTVVKRNVCVKCYDRCFFQREMQSIVRSYLSKRPNVSNLYLQFHPTNDLRHERIKSYLLSSGIKEPRYSKLLEEYTELVAGTPSMVMWQDRGDPLQRWKIPMPDGDTIFYGAYDKSDRQVGEGRQKYPWETKQAKIFWRGKDNYRIYRGAQDPYNINELPKNFPRAHLVSMGKEYPTKIDAKFSEIKKNRAGLERIKLAIHSDFVSITQQQKYKYLISIDSFSINWILKSNSVLLRPNSTHVIWYVNDLVPYKHYYPVKEDLSDLLEAYDYLEKNQDKAKKIVEEAQAFARNKMNKEISEQAFFNLLDEYVEVQNAQNSIFQDILPAGVSFEDIHDRLNDTQRKKILKRKAGCSDNYAIPIVDPNDEKYFNIAHAIVIIEIIYGAFRLGLVLIQFLKRLIMNSGLISRANKDTDIVEGVSHQAKAAV